MRIVLPLLLLAALTGCASPAANQTMPEQTESASVEPSQTMDPMESETMDAMETEAMEDTESADTESSASPTATLKPSAGLQLTVVSMTSRIGLKNIQVAQVQSAHYAGQMALINSPLNTVASRDHLQRWTAITSAHLLVDSASLRVSRISSQTLN